MLRLRVFLIKIDLVVPILMAMDSLIQTMGGFHTQKVLQMLSHLKQVNGMILMVMDLEIIKLKMRGNQIVVFLQKAIAIGIDGDVPTLMVMVTLIQIMIGLHTH